jgi:hypothetical protein
MLDYSKDLRRLLADGNTLDQSLAALRAKGVGIIPCISAVKKFRGCDLAEAKEIVHSSSAWADKREEQEQFYRELNEIGAMPRHHPRPADDFTVDCFAWVLDIERRHRDAGFPPVAREVLARRFWQFLRFLQQHGFTSRVLATSVDDISEQTVIRNSDLTDSGFYFVQRFHGRWVGRTHKDRGEEKEEAFLKKWYSGFQEPVV